VHQADIAVQRHRHRAAGDLGVAMRRRDRVLLVDEQDRVRPAVRQVVDDAVVQPAEARARRQRQRLDPQGTQQVGDMIAPPPPRPRGVGVNPIGDGCPRKTASRGVPHLRCRAVCFVGPGMRAGVAGLAQIDRSLEEASLTLRANSYVTIRRIVMPLLRPAIVAGLVYGFVTAMTTVSAVIFLVSPGVMLATVYIVNLAEAGTYGMAIAYSSVLIVLMLLTILGIERLVGERRIGRRSLPVVQGAV
jgi:hypothetical protein